MFPASSDLDRNERMCLCAGMSVCFSFVSSLSLHRLYTSCNSSLIVHSFFKKLCTLDYKWDIVRDLALVAMTDRNWWVSLLMPPLPSPVEVEEFTDSRCWQLSSSSPFTSLLFLCLFFSWTGRTSVSVCPGGEDNRRWSITSQKSDRDRSPSCLLSSPFLKSLHINLSLSVVVQTHKWKWKVE